MCLQDISILSMEEHGPDGLQIEENLPQSKRHFFARVARHRLNRM